MLAEKFGYLVFAMCLVTIYGLFIIKDKVSTLEYQLREVTKQIDVERDTIHVLKGEFAYLSSPARLRKIVSNFLELDRIKMSQMIKNPLIAGDDSQKAPTKSVASFTKHNTKWRYKRGPSKYLQVVANKR